MLSSVARSFGRLSVRPVYGEASTSRLPFCATPFVRSTAAIHTSAVRHDDSFSDQRDATSSTQTASSQSVFSLPTLTPGDVLPESFRAAQTTSAPSRSQTASTIVSDGEVYSPRRESHRLHVQASRNNIIITLTTADGHVLTRSTAGKVGFKNAARSSYEAAYSVAMNMFDKIYKNRVAWHVASLDIIWKDFGKGREATYRALLSNEGRHVRGLIRRMSDNTPIQIGGCRPKKRRML